MANQTTVISGVEADVRWRDWQARGVPSDRRTATRVRGLTILVFAVLIGWLVVQLT